MRELEKQIRAHKEKGMSDHADVLAAMIKKIEAAPADTRPLRTLDLPKNNKKSS